MQVLEDGGKPSKGGAAWLARLVGLSMLIAYSAIPFFPVDDTFQAKVLSGIIC